MSMSWMFLVSCFGLQQDKHVKQKSFDCEQRPMVTLMTEKSEMDAEMILYVLPQGAQCTDVSKSIAQFETQGYLLLGTYGNEVVIQLLDVQSRLVVLSLQTGETVLQYTEPMSMVDDFTKAEPQLINGLLSIPNVDLSNGKLCPDSGAISQCFKRRAKAMAVDLSGLEVLNCGPKVEAALKDDPSAEIHLSVDLLVSMDTKKAVAKRGSCYIPSW